MLNKEAGKPDEKAKIPVRDVKEYYEVCEGEINYLKKIDGPLIICNYQKMASFAIEAQALTELSEQAQEPDLGYEK